MHLETAKDGMTQHCTVHTFTQHRCRAYEMQNIFTQWANYEY